MNKDRNLACWSGIFILAVAGYIYMTYIYMLGFPDGHVTELNRAEKTLFSIFIGVSTILSSLLFWIGFFSSERTIFRRLRLMLFLYLLLALSTLLIDYYFRLHLAHNFDV